MCVKCKFSNTHFHVISWFFLVIFNSWLKLSFIFHLSALVHQSETQARTLLFKKVGNNWTHRWNFYNLLGSIVLMMILSKVSQ
jgi:hypothetical protein